MKRTKMFLSGLVLSACVLSLQGCGKSDATAAVESGQDQAAVDFSSTGFVLREEVVLSPVGNEAVKPFTLPPGTELAVIGEKKDEQGNRLLHIGLDVQEGSELPSDLWVSERDLPDAALEPYAPADENEMSHEDMSQEDYEILKKMTYCYRYVKQYLLQTGKVKVYLPGVSAYQAASILPKHGFRRTGNTPRTAKNGEVCVYSGGPQGHGHIEVKRNGKWWYGYGYKANPISGRRFMACFYK